MKKALIFGIFFFFLVITFVLVPVATTGAQAPQFVGDEGRSGIVPCGDLSAGELPCTACDLTALTQDVINLGVYLTAFVAVLLFVYAGFLYLTAAGSSDQIGRAHNVFGKVVVGMVIVLIAWLVVDTLMTGLFQGSDLQKSFGRPWQGILCGGGAGITARTETTGSDLSAPALSPPPSSGSLVPVTYGATYTDAQAQDLLSKNNIDISSNNPSFEGVKESTINEIINLQKACNCAITLSEGTKTGQATKAKFTHENGYKVNISQTRSSPQLNQYIVETWGADIRDSGFGDGEYSYRFHTSDNIITVQSEKGQWDIQVIPINVID